MTTDHHGASTCFPLHLRIPCLCLPACSLCLCSLRLLLQYDFRYDITKGLRPRRSVRQAMQHGENESYSNNKWSALESPAIEDSPRDHSSRLCSQRSCSIQLYRRRASGSTSASRRPRPACRATTSRYARAPSRLDLPSPDHPWCIWTMDSLFVCPSVWCGLVFAAQHADRAAAGNSALQTPVLPGYNPLGVLSDLASSARARSSSSTWPSRPRRRSTSAPPARPARSASRRASPATRPAPSAAWASSAQLRTRSTTTPTRSRCCSAPPRSASSTAWPRPSPSRRRRAPPRTSPASTWTSSSTTRRWTSTCTSPCARRSRRPCTARGTRRALPKAASLEARSISCGSTRRRALRRTRTWRTTRLT